MQPPLIGRRTGSNFMIVKKKSLIWRLYLRAQLASARSR